MCWLQVVHLTILVLVSLILLIQGNHWCRCRKWTYVQLCLALRCPPLHCPTCSLCHLPSKAGWKRGALSVFHVNESHGVVHKIVLQLKISCSVGHEAWWCVDFDQPWLQVGVHQNVISVNLKAMLVLRDDMLHCEQWPDRYNWLLQQNKSAMPVLAHFAMLHLKQLHD